MIKNIIFYSVLFMYNIKLQILLIMQFSQQMPDYQFMHEVSTMIDTYPNTKTVYDLWHINHLFKLQFHVD